MIWIYLGVETGEILAYSTLAGMCRVHGLNAGSIRVWLSRNKGEGRYKVSDGSVFRIVLHKNRKLNRK